MPSLALTDSHCHLDFPALSGDHQALLGAAKGAGIGDILVPGVCPEQWPALQVLQAFSNCHSGLARVHAAAGLHPWWIESYLQSWDGVQCGDSVQGLVDLLRSTLQQDAFCALGECGLDGTIELPLVQQLPFFDAQLALAAEMSLPLIIHAHGAHNEVQRCLKAQAGLCGGVIHGFSGSPELAQSYWRLGFALGIGGTITYERAKKTRRAVAQLPWDALLLETDAPDMPLSGHQGEPNSPLRLPEVAEALAQLRGSSVTQVATATTNNAWRIFGF
jgi:TatD DNase family protein